MCQAIYKRKAQKIPVFFPDNGNSPGEGFAVDCIHRHFVLACLLSAATAAKILENATKFRPLSEIVQPRECVALAVLGEFLLFSESAEK